MFTDIVHFIEPYTDDIWKIIQNRDEERKNLETLLYKKICSITSAENFDQLISDKIENMLKSGYFDLLYSESTTTNVATDQSKKNSLIQSKFEPLSQIISLSSSFVKTSTEQQHLQQRQFRNQSTQTEIVIQHNVVTRPKTNNQHDVAIQSDISLIGLDQTSNHLLNNQQFSLLCQQCLLANKDFQQKQNIDADQKKVQLEEEKGKEKNKHVQKIRLIFANNDDTQQSFDIKKRKTNG